VSTGDEITVKRRNKISTLKILSVPSDRQTSKKDAAGLYEVLSQQQLNDDLL
jgi:ribosomal 50S subunit-recycling heat shock protein